jgi:hypothetical protein
VQLLINGKVVEAQIQTLAADQCLIRVRDLLLLRPEDIRRVRIHSATEPERELLRARGYPFDEPDQPRSI